MTTKTHTLAALSILVAFFGVPQDLSAQVWSYDNFAIAPSPSLAGNRFGMAMAAGNFDGLAGEDLVVMESRDATGSQGGVWLFLARGRSLVPSDHLVGTGVSDYLGWGLAAGDFDGDGRDSFAIGSEHVGGVSQCGAVYLYAYDIAAGHSVLQSFLQPGSSGFPGSCESTSFFGSSFAVGDFDGDGFDDLAIGAPNQTVGTLGGGGAIWILPGSVTGLDPASARRIDQSTPGMGGLPAAGEGFGQALSAGDFNGDGRDDVAVGVPRRNSADQFHSGAVYVLFGSPLGITGEGSVVLTVGNLGLTPDVEDGFGAFVASGRLGSDVADDLVVGSPHRRVGGPVPVGAGVVTIFWGAAIGPPFALAFDINQDMMAGQASDGFDQFGAGLAIADFDGDAQADLAIGAPSESDDALSYVGAAHVVRGPVSLATVATARSIVPDAGYASWPRASGQAYGLPLVALDLDADANADLAVAITGHDRTATDAGLVQILFGALFATGFERGDQGDWTYPFAP
ncbi:MAG: FG-GAP repeat protein [Holophagales bacterium]|nr:MAG: FG-GAP repeat protein [Holophagales bacterium]